MKHKYFYILSALIIALALFLRLYKIENRAPFDWDQNRDYAAISEIAKGNFTLIGPVAKGEGGFFLGPLYYYLVTPVFLLLNGSPIAQPYTSAFLDVMAIALVVLLLRKYFGDRPTLLLAFFWAISWFGIEASRVSWNVALLQVWVVLFIYLSLAQLTAITSLLFGLILGLSWHIHASLIPLSLLVALFTYKPTRYHLKNLLLISVGYLFALSPLILFDLRHSGLERHLIAQFLSASGSISVPFSKVFESVFARFGKNSIAILTAASDLHFWWGIFFGLLTLLGLTNKHPLARISSVIILINLTLTLYLKEPGFPEYYLAASYLPLLILLAYSFMKIRRYFPLSLFIFVIYFTYKNLTAYATVPTTFSYIQKINLARAISGVGKEVDVRFDLPFGRESGIPMMLKREGVKVSNTSSTQVVITESTADSIFIDGEIAKDLGYFGGFRLGSRVVQ